MNSVSSGLVARRNIIDTIDAGLSFYRQEYQSLVALLLWLFLPVYGFKFLLYKIGAIDIEHIFNTFNFFETSSYTFTNILMLLLDQCINWFSGGLICQFMLERTHEQNISPWRVVKKTCASIRPLFWISFLSTILIATGLVLCFIPGVWLFLQLLFTTPLILMEGCKTMTQVWQRSQKLMRLEWGRAIGLVAITWLLLGILGFSLTYLFAGIYSIILEQIAWIGGLMPDFDVLKLTGGAIVSVLLLPMQMIFVTLFYFDIRSRKEGFDLQVLIDQL
ncbi:hypothetical protein K1X84_03665 [bacterium]|nr:hypothetical protein [bacterium]